MREATISGCGIHAAFLKLAVARHWIILKVSCSVIALRRSILWGWANQHQWNPSWNTATEKPMQQGCALPPSTGTDSPERLPGIKERERERRAEPPNHVFALNYLMGEADNPGKVGAWIAAVNEFYCFNFPWSQKLASHFQAHEGTFFSLEAATRVCRKTLISWQKHEP